MVCYTGRMKKRLLLITGVILLVLLAFIVGSLTTRSPAKHAIEQSTATPATGPATYPVILATATVTLVTPTISTP
jgi:flagellar basal body-associated protein FliL